MKKTESMEKNQHKAFMEGNKLDIASFSEPVQKKVGIFDKMHSKLEDTVAEDRKELLKQLKELDHEIQEDMLNELEDQLENNEVMEESDKKGEPKKSLSDESVLDELWKIKRTKGLSRSFLKECGVRTNITGWSIQVGKYALHRAAVFSYKYDLEKIR